MNIIPKLTDLFTGIKNSIQANLGVVLPTTGKSMLRTLGGVWAGVMKTAYLAIADNQKDTWYTTASPAALPRWGMVFLNRLPRAATQAQYTCDVSGTTGATIDANTTYLSDATAPSPNYLFILDTSFTFAGPTGTITLRALTAGSIANLAVGDTLTCTKPLVNVLQGATVDTVAVSATDEETAEQYRAAIDRHVKLAPQGGATPDYVIWASEAAGVRRVYPYTASGGLWQVNVYIEAELSDSGGAAPDYNYGIPTGSILADATALIIADPITGMNRKPMGVKLGPGDIGALPVVVKQVDITFTGTSMTSEQRDTIRDALQQAVTNIRPFIPGAEDLKDWNDTISVSVPTTTGATTLPEKYVVIIIAMNAAPGAIFTGCTMTIDGTPSTSHTFYDGDIPYLQLTNIHFT